VSAAAPEDEDPGITVLFVMRTLMGIELVPGECADCAGMGVIPDIIASAEADEGRWKTCPTCRGGRVGGNA
jgi:hypothetical protein